MALFPTDRQAPELDCEVVQVKLNELRLHHPRQWGACWLALKLWEQLELDRFWQPRLPVSRQGTKWLEVLKTQVCYQLIDPGSEWRLHRHWYEHSAMQDLLASATRVLSDDTLYRCLDKLLAHKRAFFSFLRQRWEVLFRARFDILLYDLTSTYFESDPPFAGKRQFGYSRDKRPDCVQVVIALVVTPQGFPLAYEVMPGNTSDKTTLKDFLEQIEAQYGRSDRVWIMDRGIPTEETLEQMRTAQPPVHYLVGTPKGRLSKFERKFLNLPWQAVRPSVDVKLLAHDEELYILARSHPRTLRARSLHDRSAAHLRPASRSVRRPRPTRKTPHVSKSFWWTSPALPRPVISARKPVSSIFTRSQETHRLFSRGAHGNVDWLGWVCGGMTSGDFGSWPARWRGSCSDEVSGGYKATLVGESGRICAADVAALDGRGRVSRRRSGHAVERATAREAAGVGREATHQRTGGAVGTIGERCQGPSEGTTDGGCGAVFKCSWGDARTRVGRGP